MSTGTATRTIEQLPCAMDHWGDIVARLGTTPAIFLDYDGTLTPIVEDPTAAILAEDARMTLKRLRACCPVAVVSGRDVDDLREQVTLKRLHYVGGHGFEYMAPDGTRTDRPWDHPTDLDTAAIELEDRLAEIMGTRVERKRFAVAVHHRLVDRAHRPAVAQVVAEVGARYPSLKLTGGKKVHELRPGIDWHKGRAVLDLLESMPEGTVPLYIGDDLTDEDGFEVVADHGVAIVVRGEHDTRPTLAQYALAHPFEALTFLRDLADNLGAPTDV